uniref:DUF7869 domain-containing protein n=1 Tax=Magallana gigas TaxID=29159 RepID=A0A8W8NDX1_MAGGI
MFQNGFRQYLYFPLRVTLLQSKDLHFIQIKLPFLIVGHTHEDADQMFLRMSVHIARKSVRTRPILLDLAREAYHSMPNVPTS